ncbi:MAG TPA: hypothetical protein VE544_07210, partial [Nitrososphaeraceae archaeon]|nr:hypothetical protein [Nitrososphaeraceae archaeon]
VLMPEHQTSPKQTGLPHLTEINTQLFLTPFFLPALPSEVTRSSQDSERKFSSLHICLQFQPS